MIRLTVASTEHHAFQIETDEPILVTSSGGVTVVYRRSNLDEPVGAFDPSIDNHDWKV